MQNFQNLSTKTKVAIATVALAGVIGAGVVAGPAITGTEQHANSTPIVRETPTVCHYPEHSHGGGGGCLDGRVTPGPDQPVQP